ncbi:MAG: hypothetical protein ACREQ5_21170 [Candidatus Dormibacteria bacterium]
MGMITTTGLMYNDLNAEQGSDFQTTLLIKNPNQTPVNVASITFTSQVKLSYYTANVAANLSIMKVDAPNGNISLTITAANTANLEAGSYVYDVIMVDGFGNTSKILKGIFRLAPGVTNIVPPNEGIPAL